MIRFLLSVLFFVCFTTAVLAQSAAFTSPGSYTVAIPAGVSTIRVDAYGGGGGGGGSNSCTRGGGGGGGGAYSRRDAYAVNATTCYTVVVGGGGAGGCNTCTGGTGGQSRFANGVTNLAVANGGAGGGGGGSGNGGGGAAGTASSGDVNRSGGNGGGGVNVGGGGGGGAGANGVGGNASGSTRGLGGSGNYFGGNGANGRTSGCDGGGFGGSAFGGGGGGAANGNGGAGANGGVLIWYNQTPSFAHGSNSWIGYVYNSVGTAPPSNAPFDNRNYIGYVTEPAMNFNRSMAGTPVGNATYVCNAPSDYFHIRYKSSSTVGSNGFYRITVGADDGYRLRWRVNGGGWTGWEINDWANGGYRSQTIVRWFTAGTYDFELEFFETTGGAQVSFDWCLMAGNDSYGAYPTWNAYVYTGSEVQVPNNYQGTFTTTASGGTLINNSWGTGQPAMSGARCGRTMGSDNFAVRYRSNRTYGANGIYVYTTTGNDDSRRFSIDGGSSWLLSCWHCSAGNTPSAPTAINSGNRNLVFDMREDGGGAGAALQECQMDAAGSNGSLGNATAYGATSFNLYYYNNTGDFNFPVSTYAGTNTGTHSGTTTNTSTATSANLSQSWGSGVAPTRTGQTCSQGLNENFSMHARLSRTFTKGVYSIESGADDFSRITPNGGTNWLNTHTSSCCINQTTNFGFSGGTQNIIFQMRETGGGGWTNVNINCLSAITGNLSISGVNCGTGERVLRFTGGRGYVQLQSSTNGGSSWSNVSTETAILATGDDRTWSVTPTTTTMYRVRVMSCNATQNYTNNVYVAGSGNFTGNMTVSTSTTMSGVFNIVGNFVLNSGITITVDQGCPLEINATNITISGTINADARGAAGGNGGSVGSSSTGSGCPTISGGGGGQAGGGTGGGNAGGNGSNGNCVSIDCGTACIGGRDGFRSGAGGGGGGSGGSYGGTGGNGRAGATGVGGADYPPPGAGGTAGSAKAAYGTPTGTDVAIGSGGAGGGGGGGGAAGGSNGGAGGAGGGAVSLKACNALTVSGLISANGSNGGAGGQGAALRDGSSYGCNCSGGFLWIGEAACRDNSACGICTYYSYPMTGGAGAGGGGGSGGGILLQAFGVTSISGTVRANGGNGGGTNLPGPSQGGCIYQTGGGAGGGGGRVKVFINPCQANSVGGSIQANAGSGGTGSNGHLNGNNGNAGSVQSSISHPSYTALSAGAVVTSPTTYNVCNGSNPATGYDFNPSTGGAYNSGLACAASLPAYQYVWYVTRTACASPTTGTGSSANAGWSAIAGATAEDITAAQMLTGINQVGSNTTAATYCFQRRTQSVNCYVWSSVVSVVILPAVDRGTIASGNENICNGGDPANIALSTAPSGGAGTYAYQWYYQDGTPTCPTGSSTTGWTSISGATSASYNPPSGLTGTRTYALMVDATGSPDCGGFEWANSCRVVTVYATVNRGTVASGNETICHTSGDPANIAFSSAPSGGAGTYNYQWYYQDGIVSCPTGSSTSGWNSISGATSSSYNPPSGLTGSRTYAVTVDPTGTPDCGGAEWASSCRQVTVLPSVNRGTVASGNQNICNGGDPSNITLSTGASGGAGTFAYQWYHIDGTPGCPTGTSTSGWTSIAGATSSSYDPPSGLTGTRTYALMVDPTGSPDCGGFEWSNSCRVVTVYNVVNRGTVASGNETICDGGDPANITMSTAPSGGAGTFNYQWYYQNGSVSCPTGSSTSGWTSISGATSSSYDPPSGLTTTRTYALMVDPTGSPDCGNFEWASSCRVVTVLPAVNRGTVTSGNETICNGGDPANITFSTAPSGGAGTYNYQWYYQDGIVTCPTGSSTSGWTSIGGATSSSYNPPSGLTGNRTYAVTVDPTGTPDCGNAQFASSCRQVTVQTVPTAGAISGDQSICAGGNPVAFTSTTPGSGDGSITYIWESSNSPFSVWAPVGTGLTYDPPALGATTRYRRITVSTLNSVACESAPTSTVEVTVVSPLSISTQPALSQIVCVGATMPTVSVVATGGVPPYSYQWFSNSSSSTSGGTNLGSSNGANTATLSIPTGSLLDQYYYCLVSAGGGCSDVTSDAGRVQVVGDPTISASGTTTICTGGAASLSSTPGIDGTGTCTLQWQDSPDNSTWTNISGATGSGYNTPVLTSTTYYRVIRTCTGSGCDPGTSNVVTITVVPDPSITTQPSNPAAICEDGTTTNISLVAANGAPSLDYQWQYYNGSTWANVANGTPTGAVYSGANTSNSFNVTLTNQGSYLYRCVVSATASGCGNDISNSVTVTVVPKPNITTQPTSPAAICTDGVTGAISLVAAGGTPGLTYQWQFWNGGAWVNAVDDVPANSAYAGANTSNDFYVAHQDVGSYQYSCLVSSSGSGCSPVRSNSITVTVVQDPSISVQPSNPPAICPGGTTSNISFTAANGTPSLNYQWQYFNGSIWQNAVNGTPSGATYSGATTNNAFNVTQTNAGNYPYRCLVSASGDGCDPVVTNAVTVLVVQHPSVSVQPVSPATICEGGTTTNISLTAINGTPTPLNYQWQYWNGSTWVNAVNGTPAGATYSGANTNNAFNVTLANQGSYVYSCLVTATGSGCNSARSNDVTVTVVPAPSITAQPTAPTAICVGGNSQTMSFTASGGTPSLNYQWQVFSGGNWVSVADGTPAGSVYTGGTTTSMSVSGITAAGNYLYRAEASSTGAGCNPAYTNQLTLEVVPDPSITTQPTSPAAVCTGGATTNMSVVAANGTPSLTYQWQYWNGSAWVNAVNGTPSGSTYSGATTSNAFNATHTNAGTYEYSCLISASGNGCNSIRTNTITVSVIGQPAITGQPTASQSICLGGSANLSVTATGGTPSLTYQWYKSIFIDTATIDSAITGATSNTFNPPTSVLGTITYYVVVDANGANCNPVVSNSAVVIVNEQPTAHTITKSPNIDSLCQGSADVSATFSGSSGGGGTVTDEYEFSINGGTSWNAYTPGNPISTSSIYGEDIVQIRTRRVATGSGCVTTAWNVVSWTVQQTNGPATATTFSPTSPICQGDTLTLTTNAVAGNGATVDWYTGSGATGTYLGTGNTIEIVPTSDQTYYAFVSGGVCPPSESNTGLSDVMNPDENVTLYSGNQLGLIEMCVVDDWTYYGNPLSPGEWYFAVYKNGNTVTFDLDLYEHPGVISSVKTTYPQSGSFLMKRYWNMAVSSGSIVNPIGIRFYYDANDLEDAKDARDLAAIPYLGGGISYGPHPQWFKTNAAPINGIDGFAPSLITNNALGNAWFFDYEMLTPTQYGVQNGVTYVQIDGLTSLSGGTGGTTFGQNNPILPVELISFTATPSSNSILLDWVTASEVNNDRFELFRSDDGVTFTKIGEIAGQGTTNDISTYNFEDANVIPGILYYYQLRQVDFDGAYDFSNIVSAKVKALGFVAGDLVPNPTADITRIRIISPYEATTTVRVFNILGQEVYSKVEKIVSGQNDIEISGLSKLPKGNYLVNLNTGIDQVTRKLVLVRD